jgi:hypothetical protein
VSKPEWCQKQTAIPVVSKKENQWRWYEKKTSNNFQNKKDTTKGKVKRTWTNKNESEMNKTRKLKDNFRNGKVSSAQDKVNLVRDITAKITVMSLTGAEQKENVNNRV